MHLTNSHIPAPRRFNNPFYYEPHPLCLLAVEEVKKLLPKHPKEGKMFGVLVVRNAENEIGYLAAYSGQIVDTEYRYLDDHEFVPAVYDYLQPDGYFKTNETKISAINHEIELMENSDEYKRVYEEYETLKREAVSAIALKQEMMKRAKRVRDQKREMGTLSTEELQDMIRESQFMKAEVHRVKQKYAVILENAKMKIDSIRMHIFNLKQERKLKSDHLQNWLFAQFNMRNGRGEEKNLIDIFREYYMNRAFPGIPPSGAGECCEPKMLQYAYSHHLHPLCMAMFWWGPSPKTEIRQHEHFYPACNGKCKPILAWMLQGLEVEKNPLEENVHLNLDILYKDDDIIVVNKPAGMLSVPGNSERESVYSIIKDRFPDIEGPMIVHRLDMATSGLLVLARNSHSYANLQEQFRTHSIYKRYIAILSAKANTEEDNDMVLKGSISLPLSPDVDDRPRQKVDFENGKTAITEYHVLSKDKEQIRVSLIPHTGRTHQLRVHCAYHQGLNHSIKGDELYGERADRLYLHATYLRFTHPTTDKRIHFEKSPDF